MDWQALRNRVGQDYSPRSMLDVGAHLGAFTNGFLDAFPGCAAVLIEPNPHCFEPLSRLPYEVHAFAASQEEGDAELHLTREWLQSTGASLYRENTHFFRDDVLMKVGVPKRRIDDVFAGRRFDFVKIDTQGAELDVLRGGRTVLSQSDFIVVEVSLVEYNQGGAAAEDVFAELALMGFDCAGVLEFHRLKGVAAGSLLQMDFLFARRARRQPAKPAIESDDANELLRLASTMRREGKAGEARALLAYMSGTRPAHTGALVARIDLELAQGDCLSAIECLMQLRKSGYEQAEYAGLVRRVAAMAIDRLNAHIGAGQLTEAGSHATALAELIPGYLPAVVAAMRACAQLAQVSEVEKYAARALRLDSSNAEAQQFIARICAVKRRGPAEAADMQKAFFPLPGTHPLLRLRDLHDAMAAIYCGGKIDAEDLSALELLHQDASALHVDVAPETEFGGWLKHYRVAVRAMDPAILSASIAQCPAEAPSSIVTSAGEPVSAQEIANRVARRKPAAVFFAAADRKYVELYAKHYIDSILRHCDVPFSIVLHVIGGAGSLQEIAQSLGYRDDRIHFLADGFDADAVTAKCYDTPPKGLIPIPVAHYQSARFQRVGWVLEALAAPVFVSDIDLLLQRGVVDLLENTKGFDVVLNENALNANPGSRLTANLVLLNPAEGAQTYLSSLKRYLDDALSADEVSRWIDQFGLLMARQQVARRAGHVRFAYFDTNSDINNLMYRAYEKNPFRFLSLYHGFDMSTLERAA